MCIHDQSQNAAWTAAIQCLTILLTPRSDQLDLIRKRYMCSFVAVSVAIETMSKLCGILIAS